MRTTAARMGPRAISPWLAVALAAAAPAHADDQLVARAEPAALDLRLTLSTFVFRESGEAAAPLVEMGAPVPSASPVRRYFGDVRVELADGGFALDTRVRQTTSERYQSGAAGGGEYELRTLRLRVGSERTGLVVGRQLLDGAGATKLDGLALVRRFTDVWSGTLFAGAAPQLGSRSVDTDYPRLRRSDGMEGARLVPLAGGLSVAYSRASVHGDAGVLATYVPQEVPEATSSEASRVTLAASGYSRPAPWIDLYHFALVDVVGGGAQLTNGTAGLDVHPVPVLQLTASASHVSSDVLQIAARNVLVDPDPTAIGIVQNNIAVIRVAQDSLRGGASLALARSRFEVSVAGGIRSRPAVSVAVPDGTEVAFARSRSADATMRVLDRRSFAKLRLSASATLTAPIGSDPANRARGTIVRLVGSRAFRDERGQLEVDVMAERFRDLSGSGMCEDSLQPLLCFGASRTSAAQAGALASWRVAREWLVLLDVHVGARAVTSTALGGAVEYPTAYSVTSFARVQWRYR